MIKPLVLFFFLLLPQAAYSASISSFSNGATNARPADAGGARHVGIAPERFIGFEVASGLSAVFRIDGFNGLFPSAKTLGTAGKLTSEDLVAAFQQQVTIQFRLQYGLNRSRASYRAYFARTRKTQLTEVMLPTSFVLLSSTLLMLVFISGALRPLANDCRLRRELF